MVDRSEALSVFDTYAQFLRPNKESRIKRIRYDFIITEN